MLFQMLLEGGRVSAFKIDCRSLPIVSDGQRWFVG